MKCFRERQDRLPAHSLEGDHGGTPDRRAFMVQSGQQRFKHLIASSRYCTGDGCLQGGACPENQSEEQGDGRGPGRGKRLCHPGL
ncbi:hypothetical protein MBOURGENBZM_13400 [Methanoculleus bourgensis]|nr:hypothetical protein MBOURGENBZM_13400 [Methanoculleus bourgensis]